MKCLFCHFTNTPTAKFCVECGRSLALACPKCKTSNSPAHKFCHECGAALNNGTASPADPLPSNNQSDFDGERKHITVLFSDLSGYTMMAERMDPEELREIMEAIFQKANQIIIKYEGQVERIIGDEVMALFGAPRAHEDAPLRAVKAAREIHLAVNEVSRRFMDKIGQPVAMHTGINTGLVVTGKVDHRDGKFGVSGDTVNLASRLADMASAGEILVGPETYRQASGHFHFRALPPTPIKGKAKPMPVYLVLSQKNKPITVHQHSGLQAQLIGRNHELNRLQDAYLHLETNNSFIFSVCGVAGTGKSRLIEEFKSGVDRNRVMWIEGHAYAHTQNIAYFPLIDMLNRIWKIEDGDNGKVVKQKIEGGIRGISDMPDNLIPYIGTLHGLNYPELEGMSPEVWQEKLHEAVVHIFTALAGKRPLIFFLEDLHWADKASVDLLDALITQHPIRGIVLCVHRPSFTLFDGDYPEKLKGAFQQIRIAELSDSDTKEMLSSMLQTSSVPVQLVALICDRAEGNPFYIEEIVNALIETESLVCREKKWEITGSFKESDIPSTVHGVISSRLDRLEASSKRVLQEASVIGRAFLYEILKKITSFRDEIDQKFINLERIDLVRKRAVHPDLEFVFKHVLTQEVGYSSLLIKERQQIHRSIAEVMEILFAERISEFYETLAMHYHRGKADAKAIKYLIRSGEKNLKQHALEESSRYFQQAFDIAKKTVDPAINKTKTIMDVIINWAFVYYYRGDNKGLLELLLSNKTLADSIPDPKRQGGFYAWLGCAYWHKGCFQDAYQHLIHANSLGEQANSNLVIGYASSWLSWVNTEHGRFDDAIACARKAQEIYHTDLPSVHYIFFNSVGGMGYAYWHMGDKENTWKAGRTLLDFGERHSNLRSLVLGYSCMGWGYLIAGDLPNSALNFEKAAKVSADPWYREFPKLALCYGNVMLGNYKEADAMLDEMLEFSKNSGAEFIGEPARFFRGIIRVAAGDAEGGVRIMEDMLKYWKDNNSTLRFVSCSIILAKIYALLYKMHRQSAPAENLHQPLPYEKEAFEMFAAIIKDATALRTQAILGQAHLGIGQIHTAMGKPREAISSIKSAISIFTHCGADEYGREAESALGHAMELTKT